MHTKDGKNYHYVFVYGTLKHGFGLHRAYLMGRQCLKFTWVSGFILKDLGAFPAAIPTEDQSQRIFGEVYEVDDDLLDTLDGVEGVSSGFYAREKINIESINGSPDYVNIYVQSNKIKDGDSWLPRGVWNPNEIRCKWPETLNPDEIEFDSQSKSWIKKADKKNSSKNLEWSDEIKGWIEKKETSVPEVKVEKIKEEEDNDKPSDVNKLLGWQAVEFKGKSSKLSLVSIEVPQSGNSP